MKMDLDTFRGTNTRYGQLKAHPSDVRRYPLILAAAISKSRIMMTRKLTGLNVTDTLMVSEVTHIKEIIHSRDTTAEAEVSLESDMRDRARDIGTGQDHVRQAETNTDDVKINLASTPASRTCDALVVEVLIMCCLTIEAPQH